MAFSHETPNFVSYELLLRVLQGRTTVDKPYDERLYLIELTNSLWERVREIRASREKRDWSFDS